MSTLYLIRHLDAGEPWEYPKDDDKRPLSKYGREQAHDLASTVQSFGLRRIFTGHAERCKQTVQFVQRLLHVPVEHSAMLTPKRGNVITAFMRTLPHEPTLVVTHYDNIYAFLRAINEEDGVAIPKIFAAPCGSFFVLERDGSRFTGLEYVPPNGTPRPPTQADEDDEWIE